VTSLEGVVLQLQDSCKEVKAEVVELRAENARLRREGQDREKMWRQLYLAKRSTGTRDDLPPLPTAFFPSGSGPPQVAAPLSPTHTHYADDGLRYQDPPFAAPAAYPTSHGAAAAYASANTAYGAPENGHVPSATRANPMAKYAGYPSSSYGLAGSARGDPSWPGSVVHSASSGGESCPPESGSSSHSPAFVESPTLMSPALSYMPHYPPPVEDQKMPIATLDAASYVFNGASPTLSAPGTPTSTSSTVASSYHQMGYADSSVGQDRADYGYRRQGNPDMTLHGGMADISSLAGPSRYPMPQPRRQNSGPSSVPAEYAPAPAPAAAAQEQPVEPEPSKRARKDTGSSQGGDSRSPTPGEPPISGTLAVIKAQAFGALRRNRARTKRSSGAAKVAIEALEARGIGMGLVSHKRPRLHSDDEDIKER
jgi:hypothetical protein